MTRELGLRLAGARLLAGFSGGADSTALLLVLYYLAPQMGFSLSAAHLDHGLRPSSAEEAALCRSFCQRLGIVCRHHTLPSSSVPQTGIEDKFRKSRYTFFARAAREAEADWIATGHNGNDLAEDVLMRLIRGAGWPGLSGMRAVDAQRRLLRPLLCVSRGDIEAFLASLEVSWITDESNADTSYFRNRVRHTILPLLLRENPGFLDSVAGLWRLGRIDEAYFEEHTPDPQHDGTTEDRTGEPQQTLSALVLDPLPMALRLRAYKKALDSLGPGQTLLKGLLAVDAAWMRKGEKTEHRFPGGKIALVDRKGIVWTRRGG